MKMEGAKSKKIAQKLWIDVIAWQLRHVASLKNHLSLICQPWNARAKKGVTNGFHYTLCILQYGSILLAVKMGPTSCPKIAMHSAISQKRFIIILV